jgi:SAM-dependent methyltransferase
MNVEARFSVREVPVPAETVCPACGGVDLGIFFQLPDLPTNCIALRETREAALQVSKGVIKLGFCGRCGAVSNILYDASRLEYDPTYDNSLDFSPRFQQYTDELARELVARHHLRGKSIIEVGCGNGEFLSMVCRVGGNRGIGFDPAFIPGRADLKAGEGIRIVRDYYSERYAEYRADFVICRHVLEHIATPQQFLHSMRASLAGNSGAPIFFEVPNGSFVFQNKGIWDVIYEHCFYYSAGALARLFSTCGFDVQNVSSRFDGQYLSLEARVSLRDTGAFDDPGGDLNSMEHHVRTFAQEYESKLRYWRVALGGFAEQGKRVVLWGAGAKGAMFVNAFRSLQSVEYVVDVNPHKWGLHIPGTGQEVVNPTFLKQYQPDALLIANSIYREEIERQLSDLGIRPTLFSI